MLKRTDSQGQDFYNIIGDDILAQDVGSLQHLLYDGHGSTRLLYTTSIQERYDFDAYGNAVGFDPAIASTNYLYTGEQADIALGDSYYLRARFYMPGPGMFTSLDPYFGDTGEPQSLHKYAYVHGDPVNAWDPSGTIGISSLTFISTTMTRFLMVPTISTGIRYAFAFAMSVALQMRGMEILDQLISELNRTLMLLKRVQIEHASVNTDPSYMLYLNNMYRTRDAVVAQRHTSDIWLVFTPFIAAFPPAIAWAVGLYRVGGAVAAVRYALYTIASLGPILRNATTGALDIDADFVPLHRYLVSAGIFTNIIEPTGVMRTSNNLLESMLDAANNPSLTRTGVYNSAHSLRNELSDVAVSGHLKVKYYGITIFDEELD